MNYSITVQTSRQCAGSSRANASTARGFSLIEVLIVIAIIGILAAVSYPSYTEYVKRTRRSDGHLALLAAVQSMERCRSTSYSYANCALTKPASPEGYYAMELTPAPTAATFTVVATAQDVQAGDTDCLTMSINERGQRAFTGPGPCSN